MSFSYFYLARSVITMYLLLNVSWYRTSSSKYLVHWHLRKMILSHCKKLTSWTENLYIQNHPRNGAVDPIELAFLWQHLLRGTDLATIFQSSKPSYIFMISICFGMYCLKLILFIFFLSYLNSEIKDWIFQSEKNASVPWIIWTVSTSYFGSCVCRHLCRLPKKSLSNS